MLVDPMFLISLKALENKLTSKTTAEGFGGQGLKFKPVWFSYLSGLWGLFGE
jgi:hypothetical protein